MATPRAVRIAVAEFQQETCGLLEVGDLEADTWVVTTGADAASEWAGLGAANDIMDGFAAGLADASLMAGLDATVLPLCLVNGNDHQRPLPSAVIHDLLERALLAPLRASLADGAVDGVLLSLHGSFWAQGDDDVDGTVLQRVREVVGPEAVVMSVNDQHSNISQRMVDAGG